MYKGFLTSLILGLAVSLTSCEKRSQPVPYTPGTAPVFVVCEGSLGNGNSALTLYNPDSKIMEAVSVYYTSVINYTIQNIAFELGKREKQLPLFRNPVPIVVAGGLTQAEGFVKKVEESLSMTDFPIKISEVRRAEDPYKTVANGCFLAANI